MSELSAALDLAAVSAETFEPHLGTEFDLGATAPLRLDRIRRGKSGPATGREPFSLEFSADHPGSLAQGTFRLTHGELGIMDLFLVPHGPDAAGRFTYSAVFG